jgi:predicted  nucleic acid-binding Zn-ribbon protein
MFNGVNARIDALNDHMDALNDRMDRMQETIMGFDRRVSHVEGQIEVIREQLQAEGSP